GEEVEVKVILTAVADAENVEVEAEIEGYEYNDRESTSDSTHTFDVEENVTYTKTLNVPVPSRVEEDSYKLWITISDRNNERVVAGYNLKIDAPRHNLVIKDIVLTPENDVKAGSGLLASVRVKNMGDRDEDSVKVTVSIPALGLSQSDYIDEIESGDSETSEELFLKIPACAQAKLYDVIAEVEYDEGYEDVSEMTTIEVVEGSICEAAGASAEPDVVVGSTLENVMPGNGGAIYPITILNNAGTRKSFSVTVDGVSSWGTVRISPTSTVVVEAGDSESIYVFVAANKDTAVGQQVFTATVKSGSETVEQATLTANIVEPEVSSWDKAKKGLEIALVVLVALLVILGLIIGFSKLKNDEDGTEPETETYY
ncbi:hypothetical protein JW707_04890, partial [Candidatus Woesearchaeota archaeon]|nr:hypothetical protein [Candidatus Woesearchaeota archaeon]